MKKILSFLCSCLVLGIGVSDAAVRDENATNRQTAQSVQSRSNAKSATTARTATQSVTARSTNRASNSSSRTSNVTARAGATLSNQVVNRNASISPISSTARTATARSATNAVSGGNIVNRAATTTTSMSETRTGAEYEQCKNAYFTCMDQFCKLKNDDYRRCSCSNRVYDLAETRKVLQDAGTKLTVFTENLDAVGMTAEQASAMRKESEGEAALTSDGSASKALLEAIMNSIRGKDSFVSGKYSDLNSINLAFDTTNAFGTMDAGQAIAAYNGQNLYSAVYPQCREAVKADCNDASLQRAITAYLMAIEQDCNTVQTAIETKQKEMKSAVREGSAMLDLARVENRQNHNSSDFTTCLNNVEAAILSEEVCGAGYKKCLDNGEFIDISTGKPIAGVENFYELEKLLTFTTGVDAADQKLSKNPANKAFVKNFENRVKKFAEPALDKCVEQADEVWAEYLDKAMLDIFYAQKSKVATIKQGCFDFISSCYENSDASLTAAMKELVGDPSLILQPDKITLTNELCKDYINSCNHMFDDDIINEFVEDRKDTDVLSACRAVAKQCIDSFGGTNFENYYYPYSGLFKTGEALDWFTLYEYTLDEEGNLVRASDTPVSECARQLKEIASCSSEEMLEKAFGGFDVINSSKTTDQKDKTTIIYLDPDSTTRRYGQLNTTANQNGQYVLNHHQPKPSGVASETYNQIVDILSTQCSNVQGRFVELQFIKDSLYKPDSLCTSSFSASYEYGSGGDINLVSLYGIGEGENMCPRDYELNVDTQSWGACLCWENGGRRSKWGKSAKCVAGLPVTALETTTDKFQAEDRRCSDIESKVEPAITSEVYSTYDWCTQTVLSSSGQVCPFKGKTFNEYCVSSDAPSTPLKNLPEGNIY